MSQQNITRVFYRRYFTNDALGCWAGDQVIHFYLFPSGSFLFLLDDLQCCVNVRVCLYMCVCVCVCVCTCMFLCYLLVCISIGSFNKHDGRSIRPMDHLGSTLLKEGSKRLALDGSWKNGPLVP